MSERSRTFNVRSRLFAGAVANTFRRNHQILREISTKGQFEVA